MAFIDYEAREINVKIIYVGIGDCGKTENVQHIYDQTSPDAKGELTSVPTKTDPTLFFDFLWTRGNVRGFTTRLHLYTVPDEMFYPELMTVLIGADGVVFVADSQRKRMDANIERLQRLQWEMTCFGCDIKELLKLPYVLQLNKRDLPSILPVEQMKRDLVIKDEPVIQAVAQKGTGVFETLEELATTILKQLTRTDDDSVNEKPQPPLPGFLLRGRPPEPYLEALYRAYKQQQRRRREAERRKGDTRPTAG